MTPHISVIQLASVVLLHTLTRDSRVLPFYYGIVEVMAHG
jgi:hypothetical protein